MNAICNVAGRAAVAGLVLLLAGAVATTAQDKIPVNTLDDLPKHTYEAGGTIIEMLDSPEQIKRLADAVCADIQADLDKYDLKDATTLQHWHGALLTIALLENDHPKALKLIETIRNLEDKPAKKLITGLVAESRIAAWKEAGDSSATGAFEKAYGAQLRARLAKLPWKLVQDEIQSNKGRLEILSENLIRGIAQAQMQPVLDKTGELNSDMAQGLIAMHFMIRQMLPLKSTTLAAYQEYIDANKSEKPDIWQARRVELDADKPYKPVLVAIWDSGVDPDIFKKQLWKNPNEKPDGQDDDNNGFVDDIYGPAYDYHAQRDSGALHDLGEAKDRMPKIMQYLKGFMDLQAAVDSKAATGVKKHLSELATEDVEGFLEDLSLAGNYSHGTHVAGIVAAGNPFARILIARHSYDYHNIPVARTIEWGERDAAKCRDTVAYLKEHGVRVVNMSWGEAQKDAEGSLEANGIGNSAEERRDLARKVFKLQRDALYEAIKNAPDILFVCAAGNSDNDVEFDEDIPSSFDLPNLLVVGAVDQAGEPTSFTSEGRTVQVYANGFEVESYVPGGQRMKMSGTSMASPNVANLAAKLLTIDPSLEPAQVIDLIKTGADPASGEHPMLLINPKRTVALLKK